MPRLGSRVRASFPAPEFRGNRSGPASLSLFSFRVTTRSRRHRAGAQLARLASSHLAAMCGRAAARSGATIPRRGGRVVMQRPAKPCTPVRFRPPPPIPCDNSATQFVSTVDWQSKATASHCQIAARQAYEKLIERLLIKESKWRYRPVTACRALEERTLVGFGRRRE